MKKGMLILCLSVYSVAVFAQNNAYLPGVNTFQLCPNKSGGGFYWVNTASGDVWKTNVRRKNWEYCGSPVKQGSGATGTYLPYINSNGRGMFLLNTLTGEAWFFDGKKWQDLGIPNKEMPAAKPF